MSSLTNILQLNKYGFRKVNIKKDEHIFYHPVFRADNRHQLHSIKRKKKGSSYGGGGLGQRGDLHTSATALMMMTNNSATRTGVADFWMDTGPIYFPRPDNYKQIEEFNNNHSNSNFPNLT